jgi:plastocyanin
MSSRHLAPALLAGALDVALGACGGDDGGGAAVAADTGDGAAQPCEPVGADLEAEAATTVTVALGEYLMSPSVAEADAGIITFATENGGEQAHELAFLPGGGEVPFTADGAPDEEALEAAGAFELEAYGPGQRCAATYDLEPGTYTMFCIVEAPDGETHYEKGMSATFTVR